MREENKKKKDKYNVSFEDYLENSSKIASSSECTGLVQTPPATDEESTAYADIYKIPKPQDHKRNKKTIT